VDTPITYTKAIQQEILGFGGAFTQASAINYAKLSSIQQAQLIEM